MASKPKNRLGKPGFGPYCVFRLSSRLTDSIDTSTPAGRFFFHVMSGRNLVIYGKNLVNGKIG
ncbi:hypothetical protein F0331_16675 [Klebsiella variicola]|nr:hypothetical protein F0331_16675 [Klebsiella variicola]